MYITLNKSSDVTNILEETKPIMKESHEEIYISTQKYDMKLLLSRLNNKIHNSV